MSWNREQFPRLRAESHYGGRVVECFVERPSNLWHMLAETAARDPAAEALVAGDRRLSWAGLIRECERVARAIATQGIGRSW